MAPVPTPRSAATQAPPLVSEHGRGQSTLPPRKVKVKAHVRTVVVKPPKATTVNNGGATTTAPVDPITASVNAAQLPALQAIQSAQAASQLAAQNQAQTTQGYYKALAGMLQGVAPATQGAYSQAAGADSAFGKGFANGLQMVQNQLGTEATNAAGVSGGPAPAAPTTNAADALYGVGGYIPATTMNREGAAFGAAAANLPASAAGQGANAITTIGNQQRLDQQGFTKQLADLAAQVPGLRAQYEDAAQKQAIAIGDQQIATAKANADRVYKASLLQLQYIAATGTDPRTGKLTPKAQLAYDKTMNQIQTANQRVTIAQQNADIAQQNANAGQQRADASTQNATTATARAQGYYVDQQGTVHVLPGFQQNADGTISKVDKTTTKWVPGQPVVSAVGKMRVDGYDEAHIAAQLKKWHPKWTPAQIAATLKAAPKLYADMTKEQVAAMREQAGVLKSGWTFTPKDKTKTITIGGKTYKSGDHVPPVSYSAAVNFLVGHGYSRVDATAMLNHFYPKNKRK